MKKEKELNDEVNIELAEDKQEILELEERAIMMWLPANTIEADIVAKIWHNGEVVNVSKRIDIEEVREGFKEAEQNYIPDDATFEITDKGRRFLNGEDVDE